jgi:hypothetical protein
MPTPRKYTTDAERYAAYRARRAAARAAELEAKGLPSSAPVPTMPSEKRWLGLLQHARQMIEMAHAEMESYYDERSGAWQEGERGESLRDWIDNVESAAEAVDGAIRF